MVVSFLLASHDPALLYAMHYVILGDTELPMEALLVYMGTYLCILLKSL